ncbi:MAG: hypothetical protein WCK90_05075 [archaeon]
MKRKVIRQGNQAYTLTLPIDWVRKNGINENSELDVVESEKSLSISSDGTAAGKSVRVDVSEYGTGSVFRLVGALYAKGADEIILASKKDISPIIIKATSGLIGFALISQSKGEYVLKDVSGGNYQHLDEIFKRVFQIILSFYDAAIEDVFGKSLGKLEDVNSRDLEVNKFCLYLQRAINKMAYGDIVNGRIMFTYSYMLEKIGDEIVRAWRTNIKYGIKKSQVLKEIAEESKEALGKAFDLYYQFNHKKISEIYAVREKIREKSLKVEGLDGKSIRFLRHIVKIAEDAADLNHLALMKEM